jgi:F-type H+-transporting ATPase subunit b
MKRLSLILIAFASPALAETESEAFFTLHSTEFVVTMAFLLFIGVLVYFKVPTLLGGLLDKRAADIKSDLDEARALHQEARDLLASYEKKHQEMQEQAGQIVATAKREAMAAADQAKIDLKASIARRLNAAQDQIASAEAAAVREVRNSAISVAIGAAGDILGKQMSAADRGALIDTSIDEVEAKLH